MSKQSASHPTQYREVGGFNLVWMRALILQFLIDSGRVPQNAIECQDEECIMEPRAFCDPGPGRRGGTLSFDHIIPLSLGGPNTLENIRVIHQRCNTGRVWRGRPLSPDHLAKLNSPGAMLKRRASMRAVWATPEYRAMKLGQMRGREVSAEHRRKIGMAMTGKKHSPECTHCIAVRRSEAKRVK